MSAIDPQWLFRLIVQSGAGRSKKPFIAAVQQMVENAYDANASRIDITFQYGEWFRCADNGDGVHPDSENRLKTIGKPPENLGNDKFKKNNSGRLFALMVVESINFYWRSVAREDLMFYQNNRQKLIETCRTQQIPNDKPERVTH